jgi:hypothetical protein
MRLAYTLASAAIRTTTVITIIMVADIRLATVAHRIGPFRAEFVSPTVTVRGTCMAPETGTGTVKHLSGRLRAAFSLGAYPIERVVAMVKRYPKLIVRS